MAALVVGGSASVSASADIGSPTASGKALRTYMDRGTRLTISMWDFSWLKAHHPGGAYEDLERRVAEAAERGYNTLRVDCFPSRIPEKESRFDKNWTRGVNLPQWGQTAVAFTCDVRKEVRELAYLCRKHGIWLGLDSWDKAHMFGHGSIFDKPAPAYTIAESDEEREFMRYAETWVKALKIMRDDGVLERAVWIAPMNEVPHFAGGGIAAIRDLNKRPLKDGETAQDKAQAAFAKATRNVKPGGVWERLEQIEFKAWSEAWDTACRKNYRQMIKRARGYHETCLKNMTLPSGKRLTAINTEPFGPCFWPDHHDVGWEWYKRYNADALRVVAALDIAGSSLSNYAEPLYTIWADRDWHYTSNAYLLEMA